MKRSPKQLTPFLAALCIVGSSTAAAAQALARITVETGRHSRTNTPVSCALDQLSYLPDSCLQLVEIKGGQRTAVPFQVENGSRRYLWWSLDGQTAAGAKRVYELVKVSAAEKTAPAMAAVEQNGALLLQENGQRLLQYNYNTVYPPPGVDSLYRRSGFIHPLWAPNGAVLTNIHAKGHWHHVGIWNPWTHTQFEGKVTDFWNLQKKEGTVRFAGFISKTEGPVWCGFKALHNHIAFKGEGQEKTALNEEWDIRAFRGTMPARRMWDFSSTLSCAGNSPLLLLQYRYGGGFGFRATEQWTAATSEVLTSEGRNRKAADSTRARWIKISGQTSQGKAGILVMCHPGNYDFPQPLRVWPENLERGEIMMNFSPTKMKSWLLTYGNTYTQQYRVFVFNNDISAAEAEALWNDYAHPPAIKTVRL